MLTLFLVKRRANPQLPDYDTLVACVVAARTPEEARLEAQRHKGDEGADVWMKPSTKVTVIGQAVPGLKAGLVCKDFTNG